MPNDLVPAPELLPRASNEIPLATPKSVVAAFFSGRNAATLRAYRQDLEDFRAFLGKETLAEAAELLFSCDQGRVNALALAYRTYLFEKKLAPATLNHRLAALRSLVKLARMLGLCSFTIEIESVKVEAYRDTRGPGHQGAEAMLAALERGERPKERRDYAILRLLYDLALRRAEVVSLDLEHLDLKQGVLWVLGKGRGGRQALKLPAPTRAALASWLLCRGQAEGPLFYNFHNNSPEGKRLSGTGLYLLVKKLGAELGLKVRPHGLRHAAITQALDLTGGDVRAVQRFSRHQDLKVLVQYDDVRRDLGGEVAGLVAQSTKKRKAPKALSTEQE